MGGQEREPGEAGKSGWGRVVRAGIGSEGGAGDRGQGQEGLEAGVGAGPGVRESVRRGAVRGSEGGGVKGRAWRGRGQGEGAGQEDLEGEGQEAGRPGWGQGRG